MKTQSNYPPLMSGTLLLVMIFLCFSCQQKGGAVQEVPSDQGESTESPYPPSLMEVFEAHGGIDAWNAMRGLYFEIEKEEHNEKHTIALKDRRDRVEGENFIMGYDGTNVWMVADTSYKGDPVFYHNLMFYFYAMPFVLGDGGINYSETAPLEFEGAAYPGFRITYDPGVGTSSKDEYYLYFDPGTKLMAWLGYTVTYFTQEESNDVHWIRYDNWQDVGGIKLPKSISWYDYKEGKPVSLRNTVTFSGTELSAEAPPDSLFAKPDGAVLR